MAAALGVHGGPGSHPHPGAGLALQEKNIKHSGSVTMADIIEVARIMRPRSCAKNLAMGCKEILGTAVSVGCKVDGKDPSELMAAVSAHSCTTARAPMKRTEAQGAAAACVAASTSPCVEGSRVVACMLVDQLLTGTGLGSLLHGSLKEREMHVSCLRL